MIFTLITLLLLAIAAAGWLGWQWRLARTRLVELEQEVRRQQQSQAQVMHTTKLASLGQMIAGVAHEMNTPLGFVRSNVEVVGELMEERDQKALAMAEALERIAQVSDMATFRLARAAGTEARKAYLDATANDESRDLLRDSYEGLTQLSALVLNLKGFARVDRDGMEAIDPRECIRSALLIAQHQLRDRVTVEQQLDEVPKIRCVPSQINQVFLNLITNAAQAMDEGGRLIIATERHGGEVEMRVTDSGHGIPPDVLPKIFDPFFTTKAVGEGTGLGLSIVHKIVTSHGGRIEVDSAPGRGSTFTVRLPIAA